mgnify:FL=1
MDEKHLRPNSEEQPEARHFLGESESDTHTEMDDLEQEFHREREKKVENFVLELNDDDLAPDPQTAAPSEPPESSELSSFSESGRRAKRRRAPGRRKKHGCMYRVLYWCAVLAVAVGIGQFMVSGIYDLLGASRSADEVEVKIEPDMTEDQMVQALKKAGLIKQPFFFKLYAKVTHAKFRPGTYVLAGNADYELINNSLLGTEARVDTVNVTFPEGQTIQDFAQKLEEADVCKADEFLKAVNESDFTAYSFIRAIPNIQERAWKLEGYLYPDTYTFYLYSEPETVIYKFLNNLNDTRWTAEMADRAKELNMTMDQVLTLASMIQREANNTEDMQKISSVFHNRLNNWGADALLQSDPTYQYEAKQSAQYAGSYDTYKRGGLPVGPICNPGRDAIVAALYPANTGYYYFVADVNGKTYYAYTLSEHERNIAYAKTVERASSSETSSTAGD